MCSAVFPRTITACPGYKRPLPSGRAIPSENRDGNESARQVPGMWGRP